MPEQPPIITALINCLGTEATTGRVKLTNPSGLQQAFSKLSGAPRVAAFEDVLRFCQALRAKPAFAEVSTTVVHLVMELPDSPVLLRSLLSNRDSHAERDIHVDAFRRT